MTPADFQKGLEEANRAFEEYGLPAATDRRLRARLEPSVPTARPWGWLALAGVGVALALLAVFHLSAGPGRPVAGFELLQRGPGARVTEDGTGAVAALGGPVTLREPTEAVTLVLEAGGRVRRNPAELQLLAGRATFSVQKRTPSQGPARVRVSGGVIEVHGTRFTVTQQGASGTVALHEGSIRFRSDDGRVVGLTPGEALSWPLPIPHPAALSPAPVPAPKTPAAPLPLRPARHRSPGLTEPDTVQATLDEVARARSRGEFNEATRTLREALAQRLRPSSREVLSFELGDILTYQLHDRARACSLWRSHRAAFPSGRFGPEIHRAWDLLHCGP